MKRMLLPLALLACAAACEPAPTNSTNTNANMNASNVNAANSNMNAAATWTNDDVIAGDKKAWDLIKTKDYATFEKGLDDNFIDVTPSGVHNKAETIAEVKTFDLTDVTLSDFKVIKLDNDAAIVAYTVNLKGSMHGKPIPANASGERASTAVVMRGGKWYAVFHQSSPIEPPPPMPAKPASANTNTNSANTNSAATTSTALATTSDLEANERMIWDAFEKKNMDAFANVLTDDSYEVEPEATYSKSASVDMMKQMVNAAPFKGTLSDSKTVTLDDDAKIITYVAKSPMKGFPVAGQRHSTVWVNRGGKWMAAFHQGTTIRAGM
ncbi:MAG: hypothetical protein QOE33_3096 [Acidobacteriota bacterium]|nr:hypothetical protein [Acidobacteriota bacterium]